MSIEALVALKAGALPAIGRERVRLLETVAREGSITAGAKSFGLTYKAAWDALEAMESVFGQPLLETRTGGRSGGGATLMRWSAASSVRSIGSRRRWPAPCGRSSRPSPAARAARPVFRRGP